MVDSDRCVLLVGEYSIASSVQDFTDDGSSLRSAGINYNSEYDI